MLRKNIISLLLLTGASIFFLGSCYKNKTVILDAPEVSRPVTFSQDIIPIFNSSCNMSGCHSSGGKTPDLTLANAFNSLTVGDYLNKEDAASSTLYLWVTGKKSTPMPVGGINKEYNALILAWIKQGAQNN